MLFLRNSVGLLSAGRSQARVVARIHDVAPKRSEKTWEEVRIPVPWGHIAGKWWGPTDKRPIFCVHGWQDNCGSFDRLIPLLPDHLGYLAIDFPGHGFSTQLPLGMYYHGVDATILLRRIQKYFGWERMSILAHSMGAITSFMYTCLFPGAVDMLVCLDAMKPFSTVPGAAIDTAAKNVDRFIYYDDLNSGGTRPPAYTYEECASKQYLGSRKSILLEHCRHILNRNLRPCPDNGARHSFARDSRLKVGPLTFMHHDEIVEYARRVTCPLLVIKATLNSYYEDKKYFYDVHDLLKRNNAHFEYHYVEGLHHVHLNEPDKVAPFVNSFLDRHAPASAASARLGGGIKPDMRPSVSNAADRVKCN